MLNAPAMECDRVNLRWSAPVQKRQQIFETVPVRHRAPLSDEGNARHDRHNLLGRAPSGQAPTPHSGAPKARGLTAKAPTERSSLLPRCASSSDTVREIKYQIVRE